MLFAHSIDDIVSVEDNAPPRGRGGRLRHLHRENAMNLYRLSLSTIVTTAILAMGTLLVAGEESEKPALKPQSSCPITGTKIDPKLHVDALGQRIAVCCPACLPVVRKDPEAALGKLHEQGQFAESRQTLCPVMKSEINRKLFVEHRGRRIYVCCPPCIDKVKAAPAKYAAMLGQGGESAAEKEMNGTTKRPAMEEATGKTMKRPLQTSCPIMGGPINKKLYADVMGHRVYVCCGGCIAKVKADPEAALRTIRQKGERPATIPEKAMKETPHGDG